MANKFTASTNIIRDSSRTLNYITTPNSVRIANQLVNDFKKGIRSFNIIGSYGTGKSTFILALQKSIIGSSRFFDINLIDKPNVAFLNFVGDFRSITEVFAEKLTNKSGKQETEVILSEIYNKYHDLGKNNPLLVICIDEFGKFLEYAAKNNPEKELYFIQQLAEFANNPDHNILFITTVHQNIDAYAFSLSAVQKQEWTKVKGRFRELTFNEPIEQLLFLASEHLSNNHKSELPLEKIEQAKTISLNTKAFSVSKDGADNIAKRLYPLELTSANILTQSLQKYGQNERSLFSFLESTDLTGINNYDRRANPFYNTACVYDYLIFNFFTFINSRYNPDFPAWAAIKNAIEAIERTFDKSLNDYIKIVKSVGLFNMSAAAGSDLGREFWIGYSKIALGIEDAENKINQLEQKKIIAYRNYSKRYVLSEGTDLDISSALIEAGNKVNDIVDVVSYLQKEYQLPPILAKAYTYENGAPRLFEFKISDYPINEIPLNEIDGYINLIFNERVSLSEILKESEKQEEAILYAFYQNAKVIKNQLFEIEKTKKVIEENDHDSVAVKELNNILLHQRNLLNHYILNNLFSDNSDLKWIYKGKIQSIRSRRELNSHLSRICFEVYSKAPIFKNELVNKHRISNAVHTAKKNYVKALIENWDQPDLGFSADKFPPEKTIYQTLIKENGISLQNNNSRDEMLESSSFKSLWEYSNLFLESAKTNKRSLKEFVEPLTQKPFKLKQGLLDFWMVTFLFAKRDEYALFGTGGYIPFLTDEVCELIIKYPKNYEIKAFNIEGVKLNIFNSYRQFLNQSPSEKANNKSFIETIKPFLTFYKGLADYSKHTKRLSKEAIGIREAIANSKDPEKSFFEDFPIALATNIDSIKNSKSELESYTSKLQAAIREIRSSYDGLIQRFEDFILEEFIGENVEFVVYKKRLQDRFLKLKKHLCNPTQKTFLQRLDSELDDRNAWLSSLAQAVIGKQLDTIKDEEEVLLYDKYKSLIHELDSLTNISASDINLDAENIIGVELNLFGEGLTKGIVRLPNNKMKEISEIENTIKSKLSDDNAVNLAALSKVLKELMKK